MHLCRVLKKTIKQISLGSPDHNNFLMIFAVTVLKLEKDGPLFSCFELLTAQPHKPPRNCRRALILLSAFLKGRPIIKLYWRV